MPAGRPKVAPPAYPANTMIDMAKEPIPVSDSVRSCWCTSELRTVHSIALIRHFATTHRGRTRARQPEHGRTRAQVSELIVRDRLLLGSQILGSTLAPVIAGRHHRISHTPVMPRIRQPTTEAA
jgi:hypothetical protein